MLFLLFAGLIAQLLDFQGKSFSDFCMRLLNSFLLGERSRLSVGYVALVDKRFLSLFGLKTLNSFFKLFLAQN